MMLSLVCRDPALRALPKWLAIGPLATSLTAGLVATVALTAAHRGATAVGVVPPAVRVTMVLGVWLPAALFLVFVGARRRCRPFEMSLPLPASRLWLAHLIASLAATLLLLGLSAGVMILSLAPTRLLHTGDLAAFVVRLLPPLAATLVLTASLLSARRPALVIQAGGRDEALFILAVLIATMALAFLLCAAAPAWSLLPVGLGVGLLAHTHRRLPPAFALAPREATNSSSAPVAVAGVSWAPSGRARLFPFLWRVIHHDPKVYFYLPLVVVFGVFLANGLAGPGDSDDRFVNVFLSWYMLMALIPYQLRRLAPVGGLPLSRRRLFAVLVLPAFVCLLVGYAGGTVSAARRVTPEWGVRFVAKDADNAIKGPLDGFEITWNGRAPTVAAPWGESHPAYAVALWSGGPALYKPFTAPADASPDFIALQLAQAVRAAYGIEVPAAEARRRWVTTDAAGATAAVADSLPGPGEFPRLAPRGAGQTFPAMLVLVGVPWLALLALSLRFFRPGAGERVRKWGHPGILAGLMTAQVVSFALVLKHVARPEVWTAFWKILARHAADAVPGGTVSLWVLAGLVVAGAYLFAQSRFGRIEIPSEARKGCS